MEVFIFMTYNQALMYSRFERMFVTCIGAAIAVLIVMVALGFDNPVAHQAGFLIAIVSQFIVLKCWADMIVMSRPFENCWAFKE